MPIQRQTARKVRLADIMSGNFVKKEGMEPSFVETANGNVSRARIMSTVMNVFKSEDGKFGSITLDDGTDTIRAKAFKDLSVIEGVREGQLVDVVGKVREYNGEIYMIPELVKQIEDPNMELLRRAELLKSLGTPVSSPSGSKEPSKPSNDQAELRKKVLAAIESKKDGATFDNISSAVKADEEALEDAINELLSEGICYEPTPGKIKKI